MRRVNTNVLFILAIRADADIRHTQEDHICAHTHTPEVRGKHTGYQDIYWILLDETTKYCYIHSQNDIHSYNSK